MKKVGISLTVVVLAVAICSVIVFAVNKKDLPSQPAEATQQVADEAAPQIDPQAYKEEVKKIVSDFQTNPSNSAAEKAYASLIGLRVPGDQRSTYFSLVLYFNAQSKAQQIDMVPLQQLTEGVDWL